MADGSDKAVKKRRGPGKPFQRGQSGNPGGKKPVDPVVKEMLSAATPGAVAGLIELSQMCPDANVRLKACIEIINRELGKAPDHVKIEDVTDPTLRRMSTPELIEATIKAMRGEA